MAFMCIVNITPAQQEPPVGSRDTIYVNWLMTLLLLEIFWVVVDKEWASTCVSHYWCKFIHLFQAKKTKKKKTTQNHEQRYRLFAKSRSDLCNISKWWCNFPLSICTNGLDIHLAERYWFTFTVSFKTFTLFQNFNPNSEYEWHN